jgi:DNA-binding NtrC family response regulator
MVIHYVGRQPMAHILLVEDDADVQSIISEFLVTRGHRLTCASSAEQARRFLAREPIDIALVDCLMSGEQGNSLAEHASKLGIPTILTSGDPQYIETLAEHPFHPFPFLAKPFRLTSLDELIACILQKPGSDRSR